METYTSRDTQYKTIQGDMWDMIALREYGDEHAMNAVQDGNFYQRFTDAFPASVVLVIPSTANVEYNLKAGTPIPPINQLLPWR
jgi:phage tail protein X